MSIENMTNEELNAALQAELADDNSTINEDASYEDETEETQSEEDNEEQSEEELDEVQEEVKPVKKHKSNVAKVLSERNELRKKIAELEARVGESRDTDLEYINATAMKVAMELIEEKEFFKENPEALEVKNILKTDDIYSKLDLEDAWLLYQAKTNPEEIQIQKNKQKAKAFSPGYSSTKLKSEKPVNELSMDELKAKLARELKAGKVII